MAMWSGRDPRVNALLLYPRSWILVIYSEVFESEVYNVNEV
jgi:hypothetical protein